MSHINGTLSNTSSVPVPVSFFIVPEANGCTGDEDTEVVLVAPVASVTVSNYLPTICSGSSTSIALHSLAVGTSFSWTVAASGAMGAADGSGDTIRQQLSATGLTPGTVVYTITPTYVNGSDTCTGTPVTTMVNVNPIPDAVVSPVSQTICSGATIDSITFSSTVPGATCRWTRDNIGAISGTIGTAGVKTIKGVLHNNTNVPILVTFTVTPVYTNGGVTCFGSTDSSTVLVNVPPAKPIFNWLNLTSDSLLCLQSNNINFNVASPIAGVSYHWSTSPSTTLVKDLNDPNTVISFHTPGIYEVVASVSNAVGCSNEYVQLLTVNNVTGLDERKIFLKHPGNMLIYADNSMQPIDGYQWGYDSLTHSVPDTGYSAPVHIPGAVYQFFSPGGKFLDNNDKLRTDVYAFWVQLRRGDCYSRSYYNGAYAPRKMAAPSAEDNAVLLCVIPNPNDGIFNISLGGNIYGNVNVTVRNALGQAIYHTSFSKTIPVVFERLSIGYLPSGLYTLNINCSDLKQVQTQFIIQR
jgi:hypothetical protein